MEDITGHLKIAVRLFKNSQMRGLRWFDRLTMTGSRACPEPAEGKDEKKGADGRFVKPSVFSGKEGFHPHALPCSMRHRSTTCLTCIRKETPCPHYTARCPNGFEES